MSLNTLPSLPSGSSMSRILSGLQPCLLHSISRTLSHQVSVTQGTLLSYPDHFSDPLLLSRPLSLSVYWTQKVEGEGRDTGERSSARGRAETDTTAERGCEVERPGRDRREIGQRRESGKRTLDKRKEEEEERRGGEGRGSEERDRTSQYDLIQLSIGPQIWESIGIGNFVVYTKFGLDPVTGSGYLRSFSKVSRIQELPYSSDMAYLTTTVTQSIL